MKYPKLTILIVSIGIVSLGYFYFFYERSLTHTEETVSRETSPVKTQAAQNIDTYDVRPYIEIQNPSGFVNTPPLTLSELIGKKVILLKFTTFSCINCKRTYPFVKEWYDTYKNDGLEVVFIHTPEFAYERKIENVQDAMKKEGITFPVVLDNKYATWRAYGNRFWPRMYLIDKNGNIVYDHIGEGKYDETEAKIKELLNDLNSKK